MESMLATLELNGQTFAENVFVTFDGPTPDHTGVLTTWSGSFELPSDLSTEKQVEFANKHRNACRLIFQDGRAGKINITGLGWSLPYHVEFEGAGKLA